MSVLHDDPRDVLRDHLVRLMPQEARWNYFQAGRGPMFVWTVEPFRTRYGDPKADGKYESIIYRPVGRGSRKGRAERWERDESTAMLHILRRDAKARALKLFREWEAENGR